MDFHCVAHEGDHGGPRGAPEPQVEPTIGSVGPDRGDEAVAAPRIGIFGGTFDPPHVGHVVVGAWVRHELDLDEVLFVVANDPWQKTRTAIVTPPAVRFAMVAAAIEGAEGLIASDLEIARGGSSYMVDTLETLRSRQPGAELFVIVGADAAAGLKTWHRWEELPALATIAVVDRDGAPLLPRGTAFRFARVSVPTIAITSTLVRTRVAAGAPIDGLTPAAVSSLIRTQGLYRGEVHERPTAL